MKTYQLSFGTVKQIEEDIFEVIVNEGVEIDMACAQEENQFWKDLNRTQPYHVLLNCIYPFEYDFNGAAQIGMNPLQAKLAIVTPTAESYSENAMATQVNRANAPEIQKQVNIFNDYDSALKWLQAED